MSSSESEDSSEAEFDEESDVYAQSYTESDESNTESDEEDRDPIGSSHENYPNEVSASSNAEDSDEADTSYESTDAASDESIVNDSTDSACEDAQTNTELDEEDWEDDEVEVEGSDIEEDTDQDTPVYYIFDPVFFWKQIQNLEHQIPPKKRRGKRKSNYKCDPGQKEYQISSIQWKGLQGKMNLKCQQCTKIVPISFIDQSKKPTLNQSAVLATTLVGQGLYAHQRIFSTMNMRPINSKQYYKLEVELQDQVDKVTDVVLAEAIETEKSMCDDKDANGYSYFSGSNDGAWFKKPSKDGGHTSIGGFATIIGLCYSSVIEIELRNW